MSEQVGAREPPAAAAARFESLLGISESIIAQRSLAELFRDLAAQLRPLVRFDYINVLLHDPARDVMRLRLMETPLAESLAPGLEVPVEGTGAGWVWQTQQPLIIHDVDAEERFPFTTQLFKRYGIHSVYSFPLTSAGRRLGTMGFGCREPRGCGDEELEFLQLVVRQVAVAVDNALNFESAARERDRTRLLLDVTNAVTTHLGLPELLRAVSVCLRRFFEHDFSSVVLCDEETNQLRLHALDGPPPPDGISTGFVLPMEGTVPGLAIRTRSVVRRDRIDFEEFPSPVTRIGYAAGLRSGCCVPLVSHDRVLGSINVGSFRESAFTDEDAALLQQIAGQFAVAVENALNFERATRERERAQTLLEVSNAISASLDLRDLMRATSECLRRYFKHDFAGMALYDAESGQLRVHALDLSQPADRYVDEGFMIPLEGSPAGLAFTSRRAVLVADLAAWEFPSAVVGRALAAGIRSSCNAPLVSQGRALGSVVVTSRRESAFNERDAELLTHIANQLAIAVENALQFGEIEGLKNKLASEKLYLEEEIKTEYNFAEIVGQSRALRRVLEQVETVAPTGSCVLLCGETGTGKELIARAIHNLSARRERTLVKVNCAAIPTGLLESEFFGHEKGAFTGAVAQRIGRFELAHKGTLFLDEVGEIPLELQPKLLRVLQEQEFERLGSSRTVRVDVRLIAATNCDLPQMVAERKFRADLFYRLNVFPVVLPPLRERVEDIPLLVGYFAQKHSLRMNKRIESVPTETIEALCRYPWPGNVRELENFVERAVILTRGTELRAPLAELKPPASDNGADVKTNAATSKLLSLAEAERAHIEEVLRQTNGVVGGRGGAAEILGLPISTLRGRMKKLGLM